MANRMHITAGPVHLEAQLNETKTAQAVWEALPITASASTWGDEIYFTIPVTLELEDGQETVEMGGLGYWPPGRAFCVFFGPTPASRGDEIRPASGVTVIGKVRGDATTLKQVSSGAQVVLEAATE
jgi:hypothetical protein